jgi:hypothetical protein
MGRVILLKEKTTLEVFNTKMSKFGTVQWYLNHKSKASKVDL